MRKNIVAGNWKMNTTLQEGLELAKGLDAALKGSASYRWVAISANRKAKKGSIDPWKLRYCWRFEARAVEDAGCRFECRLIHQLRVIIAAHYRGYLAAAIQSLGLERCLHR